MKRRPEPEPDEPAERRAEVERLLKRARQHYRSRRGDPQRAAWWLEAIARLEIIAAEDDPDVSAAQAAWRYGRHVVDDQASAAWRR
jgi:hypothetical protein